MSSELLLLAGTEALERFSYYGVRGILVLFLTSTIAAGGMEWSRESALRLLGWFVAFAYVMPVVGGWLGDRVIGMRRAVSVGALVLIAAYGLLAAAALLQARSMMFAALLLVALGTGLFKPGITALVGGLFAADDPRREGGFLVFYLFMNIGVALCGFVIGTLGERFAWYLGFAAASLAMAFSVLLFARTRAGRAQPSIVAVPAPGREARAPLSSQEKAAIALIGVLGIFATVFWIGLDQTAGLLNLFAFEQTRREFAGVAIPASWFQSLNPVFIIVLAPAFAWLWARLAERGSDPRTEWKFVIGLVAMACAFAVMSCAARLHGPADPASPSWLVAAYFLLTVSELCVWTISLATVTRLSPPRHVGLMVGLWYLAIAIGGWLAGQIGALIAHMPVSDVFARLATLFVIAAFVLAAITPLTAALMRRATAQRSGASLAGQ